MSEPQPPVEIRPARSPAEYLACQEAQRLAWGLDDESYVVPVATLVGVQHHGGLVLGAFLPDGRAAGLSFAFLGRHEGRWCLYSQLTGVIPGFQGRGIGESLKQRQRRFAHEGGIKQIAWSFDPLQAGNAMFNLHRLGASSRRYIPDMYGPRTDRLNAGVPTDRLIAEWPTHPDAPARPDPTAYDGWPIVGADADGSDKSPSRGGETGFLLEIPPSIQAIRTADPARAEHCRASLARTLTEAFRVGLAATDAIRRDGRAFYVLSHSDQESPG